METIHCPACKRRLQLPDDERDRVLQCPACHAEFQRAKTLEIGSAAPRPGTVEDGSYCEAEAPFPGNAESNHEIEDESPQGFALVMPKRREGVVRRTIALVSFFSGILLGLYFTLDSTPAAPVKAMVFAPLIGIMCAAMGAAVGLWVELAMRLATRPRGQSLLLTLAGEEEMFDWPEGRLPRSKAPADHPPRQDDTASHDIKVQGVQRDTK
jgi:hypothetical protein